MDKSLDKVIKKHIVLTALTGLAVVLLMITITYGLYQTNHENTTDQEISLGDFDVDLTSSSGQITLNNLNPGVENSTTYTFTTSNSGDYSVSYSVYFTDNTTTFLADETNASTYSNYTQITSEYYQYIEYKLDTGEYKTLSDVYDSSSGKFTIITGRLQPGISYNHAVKFKVASNAPNELQGAILALNITMDATVSEEVGVDTIMNLVAGESTSSTDIITKTAPSGSSCTNTLAFDGTVDNNLRYVGADPCNYVTFNDEVPNTGSKWVIVTKSTGERAGNAYYKSEEECQAAYTAAGSPSDYECQSMIITGGGWRIIGIMNSMDDGTGKTEPRIKLIRADGINNFVRYSWDSSDASTNSGWGVNEWTQADLMNELNGDYLDTSLTANTLWYNGPKNKKEAEYNYEDGLKADAQNLIGNAKWLLGSIDSNVLLSTVEGLP